MEFKQCRDMLNVYFEDRAFFLSKEKSLIDTQGKHDFNTSLLVAHNDDILEGDHDKNFIIQRTFFPSAHLPSLSRTPLLSLVNTMCNFYMRNPSDVKIAVEYAVELLDIFNIEKDNLFIVMEESIYDEYQEDFIYLFKPKQIKKTKKENSYSYYHDSVIVNGDYVKFFLKYEDGIIPILDFVFMKYRESLIIEVGIILERVYFISQKKHNIFETIVYESAVQSMEDIIGKSNFTSGRDYIGNYVIQMVRAITQVLLDGLVPSSKNPSTKKIRYWIKFLIGRMESYGLSKYVICKILNNIFELIKASGYEYKLSAYERVWNCWYAEIRLMEDELFKVNSNDKYSSKIMNDVDIFNSNQLRVDKLRFVNCYFYEDDEKTKYSFDSENEFFRSFFE